MKWDVVYDSARNIIVTTVSGESMLAAVESVARDSLQAAQVHGITRILCDYRLASSKLSTIEIHNLPKLFVDIGLSFSDRVALVYTESFVNTANLTFFDTRCYNNSLNIKVFTDYSEACQWLLTASPHTC